MLSYTKEKFWEYKKMVLGRKCYIPLSTGYHHHARHRSHRRVPAEGDSTAPGRERHEEDRYLHQVHAGGCTTSVATMPLSTPLAPNNHIHTRVLLHYVDREAW